jgi:hypothetical protein
MPVILCLDEFHIIRSIYYRLDCGKIWSFSI